MTTKDQFPIAITLDAREWGLLSCLLGAHSSQPLMSPYDTEKLKGIATAIEKQFDKATNKKLVNDFPKTPVTN